MKDAFLLSPRIALGEYLWNFESGTLTVSARPKAGGLLNHVPLLMDKDDGIDDV